MVEPDEWADTVETLEAFWPKFKEQPPEAWDPYHEKLGRFTKATLAAAIDQLLQRGQQFPPTVAELLKLAGEHARHVGPTERDKTKAMLEQNPRGRNVVNFAKWVEDTYSLEVEGGTVAALQALVDAEVDLVEVSEVFRSEGWDRDQFYVRNNKGRVLTVLDD